MWRYVFTQITRLPCYIDRHTVVECLHHYPEMIRLNPLVIDYQRCDPLRAAPADESHCTWYQMTAKIRYFPGMSIDVSYKACFYNLPSGLQTHVYASRRLDIQEKWSVGGNMPGEPRETVELGLAAAPREGLYLREDVSMDGKPFIVSFMKKKSKIVHKTLVEWLIIWADGYPRFEQVPRMLHGATRQYALKVIAARRYFSLDTLVCASLITGGQEPDRQVECPECVEIPLPLQPRYELIPEIPWQLNSIFQICKLADQVQI